MTKYDCPHCNKDSPALKNLLKETENFRVVCDIHPLTEGHILIISKKHLSCVGDYPENIYQEFISLYKFFSNGENKVVNFSISPNSLINK